MPPWYIEKDIGIQRYKNDVSLSDDEIARDQDGKHCGVTLQPTSRTAVIKLFGNCSPLRRRL